MRAHQHRFTSSASRLRNPTTPARKGARRKREPMECDRCVATTPYPAAKPGRPRFLQMWTPWPMGTRPTSGKRNQNWPRGHPLTRGCPLPFVRPKKNRRHHNLRPLGSESTSHFTEQPQDRALHMQTPTSTTNMDAPRVSDRTCSDTRPTATMNNARNRAAGRILGNRTYHPHRIPCLLSTGTELQIAASPSLDNASMHSADIGH
ncbi:hypothetical protein BDZ97DRAFT_1843955 [Flammula alnicola]|nr:hypothetical protein BDZ97DRAFT_1843955 [Flammula alnicola]